MSLSLTEAAEIGRRLSTATPPHQPHPLEGRVKALETLCESLRKVIDRCERKIEAHQLGRILINGQPYKGSPEMDELRALIIWVADKFGTTAKGLIGGARHNELVWARHVAMWIAHNSTTYSKRMIGKAFQRQHGAVLHAYRHVEGRCEIDEATMLHVQRLLAEWIAFRDEQRRAG